MAETVNPADWGAAPVDGPASWGAVPVDEAPSRVPAAFADVPKEISSAAGAAVSKIAALKDRSKQGPIEGLLTTGRAALAVPELAMSPITGAARSIGGHLLADTEAAIGPYVESGVKKLTGRERSTPAPTPEQMYETAKGDIDLALAGTGARSPRAPVVKTPTIPELKAASEAAYNSPEVLGLEIKPGTIRTYSDQTHMFLNSEGFDDIVAPKTFALLQRVQNFPPNATVTGQNLNSLRKTLGKLAGSVDPTEKAAASIAIDRLDDFLPKVGAKDILKGDPTAAAAQLEEARGNYSAAKQSEKIDKKIVRAQLRADASNSGMNVENSIRQRMADVVINDREARGLKAPEIEQAKGIAEGTKFQNSLRFVGNALGGGGGLGAVVTGIPSGGVAPAVGFGLKVLSNRMTLKQADRLSEAIRMRAPLASSTAKFGEAFANYQTNKTPSTFAGVVVAARNLSNNVNDPSFKASISSLLRELQSSNRQGE